jgi:hypothetical protein
VKRVFLCLTLFVFASAGNSRQAPVAPIAILTQFQEEPSSLIRNSLQSELDSIMHPIGLHFNWHNLNAAMNTPALELVVVNFKGHCDLDRLQPVSVVPGALGWTYVTNGAVLPFSDVDCDAVRGFVQEELLAVPSVHRETMYGRALARVLAHELYHVLAKTSEHGDCGIAKSGFTVSDLLSRVFEFHAAELRKLVASKAYKVLERAAAIAAATQ